MSEANSVAGRNAFSLSIRGQKNLRSVQKKIESVTRPIEDVTGMAAVLLVRLSTTRGH